MKVNKKAVLSAAAVLGVAGLVAGGTIAYFTDHETETNRFTVGDVKIELYESQLHRQNSGRQGSFGALASDSDYCDWNANPDDSDLDSNTSLIKGSYEKAKYCTPGRNANEGDSSTISAVANGHTRTGFSNANRTWGYKDDTIVADAAAYKTGYFARVAANIVPGQYIRKFAYVKNADSENQNYNGSDAYILISYKYPKTLAGKIVLEMPSTPYIEDVDATTDAVEGYFIPVKKNASGKYEEVEFANKDALKAYAGYEDGNYIVYSAVTTNVVKAGEMTFWSPINTIRLSEDTQNTDPTNTTTYVAPGAVYDVEVEAYGIQAKTFSNAVEAINHL